MKKNFKKYMCIYIQLFAGELDFTRAPFGSCRLLLFAFGKKRDFFKIICRTFFPLRCCRAQSPIRLFTFLHRSLFFFHLLAPFLFTTKVDLELDCYFLW